MYDLNRCQEIFIKQRRELFEIMGFETRNKYELFDGFKTKFGFSAEQSKGLAGFVFRYFLGHWRSFDILFFNEDKKVLLKLEHPFRWFFEECTIKDEDDSTLAIIKWKWSLFYKKLNIFDEKQQLIGFIRAPRFYIWTFSIFDSKGNKIAIIKKKWGGLLKEVFLDSDSFKLSFRDQNLSNNFKNISLCLAIFIDLLYFEKKAS